MLGSFILITVIRNKASSNPSIVVNFPSRSDSACRSTVARLSAWGDLLLGVAQSEFQTLFGTLSAFCNNEALCTLNEGFRLRDCESCFIGERVLQ
ncbi:hypothetical protein CDAR_514391 [Caerostris darwini]|uniref:Uncharacterized protein n=1 Tax=Caerostris darwini TaxID=1538125 RepID=A0AAV4UPK6_9ARAC|nr:hypothetical protein CDAR_514391 [Caerostris darwini]